MKVALAGCAALSSQFAVEHTLGDGKGAKIVVDGTYDADTDAYIGFDEQVVIDATDAGLSDEDAESSPIASAVISRRAARSSIRTSSRRRCV